MIEADLLLAGPRGRRMLLAFLLESEEPLTEESYATSAARLVSEAAYQLDPGRGTSRKIFGFGSRKPAPPSIKDVAQALAALPLPAVTPENLRIAAVTAVDFARYWQEPDGEDVLAALPEVQPALARVAAHIASSPHTGWWIRPVDRDYQWSVRWFDHPPDASTTSVGGLLRRWSADTAQDEQRSARERPTDVAASWSGIWWSTPGVPVPHSTGELHDDTPAGLWFVEDEPGAEEAFTQRITPPTGNVYEIDGPDAWAELCRRYSCHVTASKRHDWYRTTGRDGAWVIPDWSAAAADYVGVHLTVAGYLAAAGTAIPVDDQFASVIAGWNPDETWWLTDVRGNGQETRWVRDRGYEGFGWRMASDAGSA